VVMMLTLDDRNIRKYERDLKRFAARAYPFATKAALNGAAFAARTMAIDNVREDLTLRNKFTVGSIRVNRVQGLNVRKQQAAIGSIADYMRDQEFGAVKSRTGSEGVAIPTSYSSGEGDNARPRKRVPRRPNQLKNIKLRKSRRRNNKAAIMQAATSGRKFIFLDLGRTKGIFRVVGGKRRPRIRMVYSLNRTSVTIPASPWLRPATREGERRLPSLYREALIFQLKRAGLF